jgi:hypothetical protein
MSTTDATTSPRMIPVPYGSIAFARRIAARARCIEMHSLRQFVTVRKTSVCVRCRNALSGPIMDLRFVAPGATHYIFACTIELFVSSTDQY